MTNKRTVDRHSHGGHHHAPHLHGDHVGHHPRHDPVADTSKVKDPVCGMMVDPHTTPHRAQYGGKPYYFCSSGCQSKFMAEPVKFTGTVQVPKAAAVPEGTIYT